MAARSNSRRLRASIPQCLDARGRRRAGCYAGDLKAHASVVVAPQGQKTAATMNPALAYVGTYLSSPLRRSFRSTAKAGKALALRAGCVLAAKARLPADKIENVMSLMGQKRLFAAIRPMSALPPIATIARTSQTAASWMRRCIRIRSRGRHSEPLDGL